MSNYRGGGRGRKERDCKTRIREKKTWGVYHLYFRVEHLGGGGGGESLLEKNIRNMGWGILWASQETGQVEVIRGLEYQAYLISR